MYVMYVYMYILMYVCSRVAKSTAREQEPVSVGRYLRGSGERVTPSVSARVAVLCVCVWLKTDRCGSIISALWLLTRLLGGWGNGRPAVWWCPGETVQGVAAMFAVLCLSLCFSVLAGFTVVV